MAILVNEGGLRAGTQFDTGLTLVEDVPEAHKVALVDIAAGASIVRYGSVIGYAKGAIAKGSWVHEERMRMPVAPSLDDLPLATAVPQALPPLEGYTLRGVRQRRWVGGDEEYSGHHDDGAVRGGDGGLCGEADQGGDSAALSERGRCDCADA